MIGISSSSSLSTVVMGIGCNRGAEDWGAMLTGAVFFPRIDSGGGGKEFDGAVANAGCREIPLRTSGCSMAECDNLSNRGIGVVFICAGDSTRSISANGPFVSSSIRPSCTDGGCNDASRCVKLRASRASASSCDSSSRNKNSDSTSGNERTSGGTRGCNNRSRSRREA